MAPSVGRPAYWAVISCSLQSIKSLLCSTDTSSRLTTEPMSVGELLVLDDGE